MLHAHDYAPALETPAEIYAAYLDHLARRGRGNTAYTQAARSFLRRWPSRCADQWGGRRMNDTALTRVEKACADLIQAGEVVTFTAVATRAQIGRATLYRDLQLRAVVDEHRIRQIDARTLSGLATEVAHLRTALEALAGRVSRHEEQLRRMTASPRKR